jgi:hypothetical protein
MKKQNHQLRQDEPLFVSWLISNRSYQAAA